jgi:hypothetical protein
MPAMFGLGSVSTVACGRVEVEVVDGWLEPVNIYGTVAMEPGSRKSQSHRDATAPIREHEKLLAEAAAPDIAEQASIQRIAQEQLKRAEKAAASAKTDDERREREDDARAAAAALERLEVPAAPRLFTDDATPEAIATLLHENRGRIAVLSAESGIFGMMTGRYAKGGAPNIEVYLAGHAGDTLRVDRRGRPSEFVDRPALTVCIAVQPFVLRRVAEVADLVGRGLFDRFLYALPKGNVGYREISPLPVPAYVRQRYHSSIRALAAAHEHRTVPLVLKLSNEASAALLAWRSELEPRRRPQGDLGGAMQGWGAKLDGATVRIAGLLHLAETVEDGADIPIGGSTMEAAIEIGRYLIVHARAAYAHMGSDPRVEGAQRILAWLDRTHKTSFTKREAHSALISTFRRATDIDPALALLVSHGHIQELPRRVGTQGGRPSLRFVVNPSLQNPAQPAETHPMPGSAGSAGAERTHAERTGAGQVRVDGEDGWLDVSPGVPLDEWPDPIEGGEL